jgi:multiple sugar transport system permease protein
VILFNLVLSLIHGLQAFTQAYVMTQGGPNNATLFYVFYLYRTAFADGQMGYAAAMAWILFVIIAALTALIFRSSRVWVYYEGER